MVGKTTALNTVQKVPTTGNQGTATDATPIYTVPAGRKAVVIFTWQLIALGASANVQVLVGGVSIQNLVVGDVQKTYTQTVTLQAGKDIHFHGNVADNATVNWFTAIQETDA